MEIALGRGSKDKNDFASTSVLSPLDPSEYSDADYSDRGLCFYTEWTMCKIR